MGKRQSSQKSGTGEADIYVPENDWSLTIGKNNNNFKWFKGPGSTAHW